MAGVFQDFCKVPCQIWGSILTNFFQKTPKRFSLHLSRAAFYMMRAYSPAMQTYILLMILDIVLSFRCKLSVHTRPSPSIISCTAMPTGIEKDNTKVEIIFGYQANLLGRVPSSSICNSLAGSGTILISTTSLFIMPARQASMIRRR